MPLRRKTSSNLPPIRESNDEDRAQWEEWEGVTVELPKKSDFRQGDLVDIFIKKRQTWIQDGRVLHVSTSMSWVEDKQFEPGSVRVGFDAPSRSMWLRPGQAKELLRPSQPRLPQSQKGTVLQKERSWMFFERSQLVCLKASKGVLRCWDACDFEAPDSRQPLTAGMEPSGCIKLIGASAISEGTSFVVRTASEVYTFEAATEEGATGWADVIRAQAEYCEDVLKFRRPGGDSLEAACEGIDVELTRDAAQIKVGLGTRHRRRSPNFEEHFVDSKARRLAMTERLPQEDSVEV